MLIKVKMTESMFERVGGTSAITAVVDGLHARKPCCWFQVPRQGHCSPKGNASIIIL